MGDEAAALLCAMKAGSVECGVVGQIIRNQWGLKWEGRPADGERSMPVRSGVGD